MTDGSLWTLCSAGISHATATTGGIDDLAKDLGAGVVDKLVQIDATISRGLASDGAPTSGVYPLVVIGAPFPNNGLAVNEIDRLLDLRKPQAIGVHSAVRQPMYMDLSEFSMLCELAGDLQVHPAQLVGQWVDSPMHLTSIHN